MKAKNCYISPSSRARLIKELTAEYNERYKPSTYFFKTDCDNPTPADGLFEMLIRERYLHELEIYRHSTKG